MRRLRSERFDAAFILNRSIHSAALVWGARIPIRIGHNTEHRGTLLTHRVVYDWNKSDALCSLDLLIAADIKAGICLPTLNVTAEEQSAMSARLVAMGWGGQPLLGIQPGANNPLVREWGAEKYAQLADMLVEKHGFQTIIMGTGDQQTTVDRMVAAMTSKPIALAGKTGLREAMATTSLCRPGSRSPLLFQWSRMIHMPPCSWTALERLTSCMRVSVRFSFRRLLRMGRRSAGNSRSIRHSLAWRRTER